MLAINWSVFKAKFNNRESWAFEHLCYHLFCREYNIDKGIFRYFNQAGIETEPIFRGNEYIGFQAKFFDCKISEKKNEIIESIIKAKGKNPQLNKIVFYLCKEFSESTSINKKEPKYKSEIQSIAESLNIRLEWRVPSHFEIQLAQPGNNNLAEYFFDENNQITENDVSHILSDFTSASLFLANYQPPYTSDVIEKKETQNIITWLNSDINDEKKKIGVLTGSAGIGKTITLQYIYQYLTKTQVPCIALKADISNAESIESLEKKLGLKTPIEKSVEIISRVSDQVVVIIDQIDSLSKTLSSKRDYLGTYILLIDKLKQVKNIRILISVREYDLDYDPSLIDFKQGEMFRATTFSKEEVAKELSKMNIFSPADKLIQFLQLPIHLNIFCKIYNNAENSLNIHSQYELYNELWNLKIARSKFSDLSDTLFNLASKIYEKGGYSINPSVFNHTHINYLKTEGLIIESNTKEVSFFHQTFYDYIYGRQFVENENDLLKYIFENGQSIHIRSSIKIILAHLREFSHKQYITTLVTLLTDEKVFFHLKLMCINYIGYIDDITDKEKDLAEEYLIGSAYESIFWESINSHGWLSYFIQKDWLDMYLSSPSDEKINSCYQLLRRNIQSSTNEVLDYLSEIEYTDQNNRIISYLLWQPLRFNEKVIPLFERTRHIFKKEIFSYYNFLSGILSNRPDWVLDELVSSLKEMMQENTSFPLDNRIDRRFVEIMKQLFSFTPRTYQSAFELIKFFLQQTQSKLSKEKIDSSGLSRVHLNTGWQELYQLLIKETENLALTKPHVFKQIVLENSDTNSLGLIKIFISAYFANPRLYRDDIYNTLLRLYDKNRFIDNDLVLECVKECIIKGYEYFSTEQKNDLNDKITACKSEYEFCIFFDPIKQKRTIRKFYGIHKYKLLSSIPVAELIKFPFMHREWQELFRKFGPLEENKLKHKDIVHKVPAPYTNNSYNKMSVSNWESSLKKYNKAYIESQQHTRKQIASIQLHASAFENAVRNTPLHFIPLLEKIVIDKSVEFEYKAYGICGLVKASYDACAIESLLTILIMTNEDNYSFEYTVSLGIIEYIFENKGVSTFLFDFLVECAKPKILNGIQLKGNLLLNEYAVNILILIQDRRFEERLFELLFELIKIDSESRIKNAIVERCYNLAYINKEKAFDLFKALILIDESVLENSLYAADMFAYDFFSEMEFYFEIAKKDNLMHSELARILAKQYINGTHGAEERLFDLLAYSENACHSIVPICMHNENIISVNGALDEKCLKLFEFSMMRSDENTYPQYANAFLHFEPSMFEVLFPILLIYSKSDAFFYDPAYFCEYIIASCNKRTVHKCAQLISCFDKLKQTDVSQHNYYSNEPINTILSIYSTLGNSKTDINHKQACMEMFNRMLQQPQHREAAYKATALIDSEDNFFSIVRER